jgi:hypothetical protein
VLQLLGFALVGASSSIPTFDHNRAEAVGRDWWGQFVVQAMLYKSLDFKGQRVHVVQIGLGTNSTVIQNSTGAKHEWCSNRSEGGSPFTLYSLQGLPVTQFISYPSWHAQLGNRNYKQPKVAGSKVAGAREEKRLEG